MYPPYSVALWDEWVYFFSPPRLIGSTSSSLASQLTASHSPPHALLSSLPFPSLPFPSILFNSLLFPSLPLCPGSHLVFWVPTGLFLGGGGGERGIIFPRPFFIF